MRRFPFLGGGVVVVRWKHGMDMDGGKKTLVLRSNTHGGFLKRLMLFTLSSAESGFFFLATLQYVVRYIGNLM